MPAPDMNELAAFFGREPTLSDPGAPWIYNTLHFETRCGEFDIRCEISPSYATLKIEIEHSGARVAYAQLNEFASLQIITERGRDILAARFGELERGGLWLSISPQVQLTLAA